MGQIHEGPREVPIETVFKPFVSREDLYPKMKLTVVQAETQIFYFPPVTGAGLYTALNRGKNFGPGDPEEQLDMFWPTGAEPNRQLEGRPFEPSGIFTLERAAFIGDILRCADKRLASYALAEINTRLVDVDDLEKAARQIESGAGIPKSLDPIRRYFRRLEGRYNQHLKAAAAEGQPIDFPAWAIIQTAKNWKNAKPELRRDGISYFGAFEFPGRRFAGRRLDGMHESYPILVDPKSGSRYIFIVGGSVEPQLLDDNWFRPDNLHMDGLNKAARKEQYESMASSSSNYYIKIYPHGRDPGINELARFNSNRTNRLDLPVILRQGEFHWSDQAPVCNYPDGTVSPFAIQPRVDPKFDHVVPIIRFNQGTFDFSQPNPADIPDLSNFTSRFGFEFKPGNVDPLTGFLILCAQTKSFPNKELFGYFSANGVGRLLTTLRERSPLATSEPSPDRYINFPN